MSVTGTWPEELLLFEKYLAEHGPDDGYPLIVNDLHFWVEVSPLVADHLILHRSAVSILRLWEKGLHIVLGRH